MTLTSKTLTLLMHKHICRNCSRTYSTPGQFLYVKWKSDNPRREFVERYSQHIYPNLPRAIEYITLQVAACPACFKTLPTSDQGELFSEFDKSAAEGDPYGEALKSRAQKYMDDLDKEIGL